MSRLLITGVSGALGARTLPVLASQGSVELMIGIDHEPLSVSAPKFRFVRDELALVDLPGLLEGIDTVVHLATSTSTAVVRRLLDACDDAGVEHLVFLSSAAVYGAWPVNNVPLLEDAPLRPNPGFDYAVRLAEGERLVAKWKGHERGVTTTTLRLAMVLGGGFEKALAGALGGVRAHRHIGSSRPVQFLHIDDAVRAIGLATVARLDGVYNVGPADLISDVTARAVAGAPPRPGLPKRVAYVANDLTWRRLHGSDFAGAEPYLRYPWVISSDRLQAEGWKPGYTSEEALVSEERPTWWGSLRPGQRRALVSGGMASIWTAGTVALIAGLAWRLRHALRK